MISLNKTDEILNLINSTKNNKQKILEYLEDLNQKDFLHYDNSILFELNVFDNRECLAHFFKLFEWSIGNSYNIFNFINYY